MSHRLPCDAVDGAEELSPVRVTTDDEAAAVAAPTSTSSSMAAPRRGARPVALVLRDGGLGNVVAADALRTWAARLADPACHFFDDRPLPHDGARGDCHFVVFGFAPRAPLIQRLVGAGASTRQQTADALTRAAHAMADSLAPHAAVHVDASSADLTTALSGAFGASGCRLIVTPFVSNDSAIAWWRASEWAMRNALERFLKDAAAMGATAAGEPPAVLLCRAAAAPPTPDGCVRALACVNLKHFIGEIPATVRAAAALLRDGDVLLLFAHLELPMIASGAYSADAQWTDMSRNVFDAYAAQLKTLGDAVQRRFPRLEVRALQSEAGLAGGLLLAVKSHSVGLVALGRGARARVVGQTLHRVLTSVARERHEMIIKQVAPHTRAMLLV